MGDVIDLVRKKEEGRLFLLCDCGCRSWIIYADLELRCALCDSTASASGKRWLDNSQVEETTKRDNSIINVVELSNSEAALRSVISTIEFGKTNTLIAFNSDGYITHWTCLETSEQYDWLERCFKASIDVERTKRGV